MKRIKSVCVCLLAVLITAGLLAALVGAYFSLDRWAAFGTVGTWVTGGSAVLIAYIQLREQKLKQTELVCKSISNVKNSTSMLSESLLNLFYFINDEAESLLDKEDLRKNQHYSLMFAKNLNYYCSLIKKIAVDPYQKNYITHQMLNDIDEVNNDVDVFIRQAKSLASDERNYPQHVFAVLELAVISNELTSSIIQSINPENPYKSLLKEQLDRASKIIKLKSQRDHTREYY